MLTSRLVSNRRQNGLAGFIAPDGGKVVIWTLPDYFVCNLWDLESNKCVAITDATLVITSSIFSSTGRFLAAKGVPGGLCVCSWEDGFKWHKMQNADVPRAFSPDDVLLASLNEADELNIWDWRNNVRMHCIHAPDFFVVSAAFTLGARHLIGASTDGRTCFWDLGAAHQEASPLPRRDNAFAAFAVSRDGNWFAMMTHDIWNAIIVDTSTWKQHVLEEHRFKSSMAAFSSDSRMVAFMLTDGSVWIYSVRHKTRIHYMMHLDDRFSSKFAFNKRNELIGLTGAGTVITYALEIDAVPRILAVLAAPSHTVVRKKWLNRSGDEGVLRKVLWWMDPV